MTVYIVYTEYQNGDPSIIGVYADQSDAARARDAEITTQQTEYGHQVWGHETDEQDEAAWDVDVHLEAFEVIPSQSDRASAGSLASA